MVSVACAGWGPLVAPRRVRRPLPREPSRRHGPPLCRENGAGLCAELRAGAGGWLHAWPQSLGDPGPHPQTKAALSHTRLRLSCSQARASPGKGQGHEVKGRVHQTGHEIREGTWSFLREQVHRARPNPGPGPLYPRRLPSARIQEMR